MEDEIEWIQKNDFEELFPLPNNKSIIVVKWIYKLKHNIDGSNAKYKAHLVVKCYV